MLRRSVLVTLASALLAAAPAFCALTADPVTADFGPVDPAGAPYSLTVTVTNNEGMDAFVESIDLTDDGGLGEFSLGAVTDHLGNDLPIPLSGTYTLPAGASFYIEVLFSPSVATPPYFGSVTVYDNIGGILLDLPLAGSVAFSGVLTADPVSVDFGAVDPAGAPYSLTVTVTNNEGMNAFVESIDLTDDGGFGEFSLGAVTDALGDPVSPPFILLPGASFYIEVLFSPSVATPPYFGSVTVYDNIGGILLDLPLAGAVSSGGGGGNGGETEPELEESEEGLFIGPCFLGVLPL